MKKKIYVSTFIIAFVSINLIAIQQLYCAMNVLQTLKLSEKQAGESIFSGILNAYWYMPNADAVKKIATGDRAAFVKELGQYVKAYIKSDTFQKMYSQRRVELMPSKPEAPESIETRKENAKRGLEELIKDYQRFLSEAESKEDSAGYKAQIESTRKELKEVDNPDNPEYSKAKAEEDKKWYEQEMQQYQESLTQWEKENPANPDKLIKAKLEEFLKESENIDFNAALVKTDYGKMVFANPEYEKMSDLRKMCFRAGKSAVDEARAFAQEWLKELDQPKDLKWSPSVPRVQKK
jgi:hypothetical protein